jgi:molybdopterin-guanine dinucleotide biosynthesis protein B
MGLMKPKIQSKDFDGPNLESPPVLAVIGTSGSGKTTIIEFIVKQLSERGLRVGTVKHVHHHGFTLDTEGKDTWRHSKAGARVVVCVSPGEIAKIQRRASPPDDDLEKVLSSVREDDLDILVLEGFRSEISRNEKIHKIVVAKDEESLRKVMEQVRGPVLAISGPVANREELKPHEEVPLVDLHQNGERIIQLISGAFML